MSRLAILSRRLTVPAHVQRRSSSALLRRRRVAYMTARTHRWFAVTTLQHAKSVTSRKVPGPGPLSRGLELEEGSGDRQRHGAGKHERVTVGREHEVIDEPRPGDSSSRHRAKSGRSGRIASPRRAACAPNRRTRKTRQSERLGLVHGARERAGTRPGVSSGPALRRNGASVRPTRPRDVPALPPRSGGPCSQWPGTMMCAADVPASMIHALLAVGLLGIFSVSLVAKGTAIVTWPRAVAASAPARP